MDQTPNDKPHVANLPKPEADERHMAGVKHARARQVRVVLNGVASAPILAGMCTLFPPLGVTATAGGMLIAFTLTNIGTAWISVPGYLEGVKCWDIAHGYGSYYN